MQKIAVNRWNPITWRSSDRNVATVDRNGNVKITGNKVGSAIITASCTYRVDGPAFSKDIGTCKVTVSHSYKTTTTYREPTLYRPGGNVVTSLCSCGSKKSEIKNRKDFQYTEKYILRKLEKIGDFQS